MKQLPLINLHPLLSDRVRLAIMAMLAGAKKDVDFTSLLTTLQLSRGNLSTHLRRLEEAGFIKGKKEFIDRKPRSSYRCTERGHKEIKLYLESVSAALKMLDG